MARKICKGHIYSKRVHKNIMFLDILEINKTELRQLVVKKWYLRDLIDRAPLSSYLGVETMPDSKDPKLGEVTELQRVNINRLSKYSPKNAEEWGSTIKNRYPWLAFRTIKGREMLLMRAKLKSFWRSYMSEREFIEVDTPILTMPSEEGSRNFVVPYRLERGKYFALAQSPQLYKQILAYGGINYYQIAPVFRDEDGRKDRVNGEFYQLDVEMETNNLEDLSNFCVRLIEETLRYFEVSYVNLGELDYHECVDKYGSDKPPVNESISETTYEGKWALERPLQITTIVNFPLTESDKEGKLTYLNNPFTKTEENNRGDQFDVVISGIEVVSGGLRETDHERFGEFLNLIGISERYDFLRKGMRSGVYQHGGFGLGLERLLQLIVNETFDGRSWNVNEVVPFPLNDRKRNKCFGYPKSINLSEEERGE